MSNAFHKVYYPIPVVNFKVSKIKNKRKSNIIGTAANKKSLS